MAVKQIFFKETGPLVEYDGKLLWVEDLNPHISTKWRMSRFEVFVFGLRAIWAAVSASRSSIKQEG